MDEIRQDEAHEEPVETYESLASLIELTLLAPGLSADDVDQGCRTAREYGVAAVVVRPCDVELASRWMGGSPVKVASVAGYPYGISTTGAKLYEGRDLLRIGVRELDFVLNPAAMISRQFQHVETELMQIVQSAHESDVNLTVVCNNRILADDLKIIATRICKRVEADAIAIQHLESDLTIIKPLLKDLLRLKRSDAVMTLEEALISRAAGYSRITTPNVVPILDAWKQRLAEQAKQQQLT
jgi:deoxyribose-phosphate aldolase